MPSSDAATLLVVSCSLVTSDRGLLFPQLAVGAPTPGTCFSDLHVIHSYCTSTTWVSQNVCFLQNGPVGVSLPQSGSLDADGATCEHRVPAFSRASNTLHTFKFIHRLCLLSTSLAVVLEIVILLIDPLQYIPVPISIS